MKYLLVTFLVLVSINSFSQNYYEEGKELYNSGKDDLEAIKLFSKSIEANENIAESYLLRGSIKLWLGDLEGSYKDLTTSELLDSTDSDVYYYKGNLLLTMDSLTPAMIYYNKGILLNSKDAMLYAARGILYLALESYTKALDDLNDAINLDSTREDLFNNRGYCFMMLKEYEYSELDFNRAINLGGKHAIGNKGELCLKLERYEEAIDLFDKAILIFPDYLRIKYLRAEALIAIGKINEACIELRKISKIDHDLPDDLIKEYCIE